MKNKDKDNIRYGLPAGDHMLDDDGMIVEPDVRKSILKYFRSMGLMETTYSTRSTYIRNPFASKHDDPAARQEEFNAPPDDPVGLVLLKKKMELAGEIDDDELVRECIRLILIED